MLFFFNQKGVRKRLDLNSNFNQGASTLLNETLLLHMLAQHRGSPKLYTDYTIQSYNVHLSRGKQWRTLSIILANSVLDQTALKLGDVCSKYVQPAVTSVGRNF